MVLGELFQCALPGRDRLSQLLSCVLQLFDCKPVTAVWWDCSWSLLVCVAMNPPKEGPLKALGDSTLTLD